ncbi:hypothetical protein DL96DRAFT_717367 [Flagelloscypha sp. PMI_526]|nr:hypothetical protein DL96DRAFT_717367 [Flagelloscypha sp. PMI_526]
MEAAVIARNLLIFTLILDGENSEHIWEIFFHFKISANANELLVSQCQKLHQLTANFESWESSAYSRTVRISTLDTLPLLHQRFSQYSTFDQAAAPKIWSKFVAERKSRGPFRVHRCGGVFALQVFNALEHHPGHFWSTGTTSRASPNPTLLNPTFVFTQATNGDYCRVHYGTYPLSGFHLAEAYTGSSDLSSVTEADLVRVAKSQFERWSASFAAIATSTTPNLTIVIRIVIGDALAFCHTLNNSTTDASSLFYSSPWRGSAVQLADDYEAASLRNAPTTFNVIDSSNLVDHVGLLNLVVAASPLLETHPLSTLYTETLLTQGLGGDSGFLQKLCTEPSLAGLLFGIAPQGCLSAFTSVSDLHEVVPSRVFGDGYKQYHERIPWRIPHVGVNTIQSGRLQFTPAFLAKVLYDIYYQMFIHEDMVKKLEQTSRAAAKDMSVVHYNGGSYVALLKLVRRRVSVDWEETMGILFDEYLHKDQRLLMASNNYQELCGLLYFHGVYEVSALQEGPSRQISDLQLGVNWKIGVFKDWDHVPPVVCLVLVVPRAKIAVLDRGIDRGAVTPMVQFEIAGGSAYRNVFSTLQVVCGSLAVSGTGSDQTATIEEDPDGIMGSSPLIVFGWVIAHNLAIHPHNTTVNFSLHSTPVTVAHLNKELGMRLCLFQSNIKDTSYVHVLSYRPNLARSELELSRSRSLGTLPSNPGNADDVVVDGSDPRVLTMKSRWPCSPSTLAGGVDVKSIQVAPCVLVLNVAGKRVTEMLFPYPVDGSLAKLSVARKSGWVEVAVPVLNIPKKTSSPPPPFISTSLPSLPGSFKPLSWPAHRLALADLPVLPHRPSDISWLNSHISLAFSDREKASRERDVSSAGAMVNVKDTLHCLFLKAIEAGSSRVFGFINPEGSGFYLLLYLNEIRLDLAAHTIVVDAAVLPLSPTLARSHVHVIESIANSDSKRMIPIVTKGSEVQAWNYLLPVFVERCRTWQHKDQCAYKRVGHTPVSTEFASNPLCDCGIGVDLGERLTQDLTWKPLRPYMTRIAISPLFAVSWLDPVGAFMGQPAADHCATCGKGASEMGGKLLKCAKCKAVSYCGKECQKKDWKVHKNQCATVSN